MAYIVDERIEAYAEAHTTPSGELYERLADETRAKTTAPQMMVGELEGRFLEFSSASCAHSASSSSARSPATRRSRWHAAFPRAVA